MKKTGIGLALFLMAAAVFVFPGSSDPQESKRMKPALLVIDIQNEYLPLMDEKDKGKGMNMINAAIRMFRAHGFPIIRVYHTNPGYGPEPGTEDFEFPESVKIEPDDPKIVKNFPNAFKKTELDNMLREQGVNTVFLCGLSAVGCVLATYFGALDLDYNAFMLKDHLISHDSYYTDSVEEIFDALGYKALIVMLANAPH